MAWTGAPGPVVNLITGPSYFSDHDPQLPATPEKSVPWLGGKGSGHTVKPCRNYRPLSSWITLMPEQENYYPTVVQGQMPSVSMQNLDSYWNVLSGGAEPGLERTSHRQDAVKCLH